MPRQTWYAVFDGETGQLLSIGTDLPNPERRNANGDQELMPVHLQFVAVDADEQPLADRWNPQTRAFDLPREEATPVSPPMTMAPAALVGQPAGPGEVGGPANVPGMARTGQGLNVPIGSTAVPGVVGASTAAPGAVAVPVAPAPGASTSDPSSGSGGTGTGESSSVSPGSTAERSTQDTGVGIVGAVPVSTERADGVVDTSDTGLPAIGGSGNEAYTRDNPGETGVLPEGPAPTGETVTNNADGPNATNFNPDAGGRGNNP